jgi:hypothetical protein
MLQKRKIAPESEMGETVTSDNPTASAEEFLGRVRKVLGEQLEAAAAAMDGATATDPGAFLDVLARHGFSLVGTETLREMERGDVAREVPAGGAERPLTGANGTTESTSNEPGIEQDTGGTGIDVVIRAARTGKGCALDAERTARVEAVYQELLSRIREKEEAALKGETATREAPAGGVTHAHGQHGTHWHDAAAAKWQPQPVKAWELESPTSTVTPVSTGPAADPWRGAEDDAGSYGDDE